MKTTSDLTSTEKGNAKSVLSYFLNRCMDLHLKKLQEIKQKAKKQEMKQVDKELDRKH